MTRVGVVGGTNQIAAWLIPLLLRFRCEVVVLSRATQPAWTAPHPALTWRLGPIPSGSIDVDAVVYLAPLGQVEALTASFRALGRIIAFSSTSVLSKARSPSASERGLAAELAAGEASVRTVAAERGVACAILRPTLIYGSGLDQNLTRLAQRARRRTLFPLVAGGRGDRSPVHAEDLAGVSVRLAVGPEPADGTWSLPGGEVLSYRAMIERLYASLGRRPWFVPLPSALVPAAAALARRLPGFPDLDPAMLLRMGEDLVFELEPARRDLDFAPRPFAPDETTWARPADQAFSRR